MGEEILIRSMSMDDYGEALELWHSVEGLAVSEADSPEQLGRYLERNHGFSFVCVIESRIAGTLLSGHDGRRGYMYHLAVDPAYRSRGIASQLVEHALEALRREGIDKCHIFVISDNETGKRFWSANGWEQRSGFYVYSKSV
ncbi:GNAT family N-acetyltransferase [Paenibacillus medicaginis]|uniref:GNAT family N-acetyltransferase n=1 Tax=Paenibacillus medicaginis TaxID=1470560 RepID=A0ABV5C2D3_9BACL